MEMIEEVCPSTARASCSPSSATAADRNPRLLGEGGRGRALRRPARGARAVTGWTTSADVEETKPEPDLVQSALGEGRTARL